MTKVRNIIKAFSTALPKDEQWYKDRLSICGGCKYNSENVENASSKVKLVSKTVCGGGAVCTACGCCVSRKASLKEEYCGLKERPDLEESPKWSAIELDGFKDDKNLTVEKLDNVPLSFESSTGKVVVEAETSEPSISFNFRLNRPGGLKVVEVQKSCGCTASHTNNNEDGSSDIKLTVSTVNFKQGVQAHKTVKCKYVFPVDKKKEVNFLLKIKKV